MILFGQKSVGTRSSGSGGLALLSVGAVTTNKPSVAATAAPKSAQGCGSLAFTYVGSPTIAQLAGSPALGLVVRASVRPAAVDPSARASELDDGPPSELTTFAPLKRLRSGNSPQPLTSTEATANPKNGRVAALRDAPWPLRAAASEALHPAEAARVDWKRFKPCVPG
jgi:hypothetical protein